MNTHLATLVPRLKDAKVLCLGDVMLDRFVYGAVDRISPEAPIPVLRIARELAMLGGAGNVLRNLAALGVAVEFISVVGNDAAGREIMQQVGALENVAPHMLVERGRPSTIKTRYVAGAQQMLRADSESLAPIVEATEDDIIRLAADALETCSVLAISDYAKGLLTPRVLGAVIAAARAAKKPVIVDPKGSDYARYSGAMLLTPNRKELAQAAGVDCADEAGITQAARALIAACDLEALICTRGAEGMTIVPRQGKTTSIPAAAREVFDVSGAGDTVVATLASGLGAGLSLIDAATLANAAAGVVVGKIGTAVVFADELIGALRHEDFVAEERKVLTLHQAVEQAAKWRTGGLKVGFTNGCFDLLHPGHVSLLREARRACDRLVLGLNSDASVKRLKGKDRPVQNEIARATVLASLADVDAVVIFDEDTPRETILALKPDVLVKGADYKVHEVVGHDLVPQWGGRVVLASIVPGHSTSATIKKLGR